MNGKEVKLVAVEFLPFVEESQDYLLKDRVSVLIDYVSKGSNQFKASELQDRARLAEDIGQAKIKHIFNDTDSPGEKVDADSDLSQQVQGNLLPSPRLIMQPFVDLPEAGHQQLTLIHLCSHLS